jgi:hypothetical protein
MGVKDQWSASCRLGIAQFGSTNLYPYQIAGLGVPTSCHENEEGSADNALIAPKTCD